MLKFAIIGPDTANTQDLFEAVKLAGHQARVFKLADVTFETVKGQLIAVVEGENVCLSFDVVLFRGYDRHISEAQLLAKMFVEKNVTIIEQILAENYIKGKIQQAERLSKCNIKHPKTFQANNFEGWKKIFSKINFPIIAKPILGCKGKGIQKLNNKEEAEEFFGIDRPGYLVQQYFPIVSDFRIFVVGGEIVGGFQRFIKEGQYKSNIRGTTAERIEVSEKMKKIAIDSSNAVGYEIAGVDLFQYGDELYIIEVNETPQWEKFKLVTGINPAKKIIEYAIGKHSKK